MKALCLLLILANVALFIWEYREGGLNDEKNPATHLANPDVETIFLAAEVEQNSELVAPEENQPDQAQELGSMDTARSQPQLENTATTPPQPSKTDKPKPEPKTTEPAIPQTP